MGKQESLAKIKNNLDRMSWESVLKNAVSNIPESSIGFVKDIITPILHPIDTGKAIAGVGAGAIEKIIPGKQEHEVNFDALLGFMKNRYGSVENFKKTVSKDPVGVFGDIASVFTAGGGVVRGLGVASKARSLQTAGKMMTKAGIAADPINVVHKGISAVGRNMPEKMYQSAAKFSTVAGKKERLTMTQLALEKKIMPTYKGLQDLNDRLQKLGNQIDTYITSADQSGKQVALGTLFKDFAEIRKNIRQTSTTPQQDIKTINRIQRDIIKMNKDIKRLKLNPSEIQAYKTSIYDDIERYYKRNAKRPISVKSRMAIAHNAKNALEDIIPEIKNVNKEYGALKELHEAIEKASARIENRDLMGIGVPIKTGAGAAAGDIVGGMAGLLYGILDTPKIKAKLAILLTQLRKKGISITPTKTAIELGLFQSGRLEKEDYPSMKASTANFNKTNNNPKNKPDR